jgi:hypothetical protein
MKIIFALFLALLTAACAVSTAQPLAGLDPADPEVAVPPVRAASTLGSYISQRPVDPAPWRERNERVAPKTNP